MGEEDINVPALSETESSASSAISEIAEDDTMEAEGNEEVIVTDTSEKAEMAESKVESEVENILQEMTTSEKVAQLFLISYDSVELSEEYVSQNMEPGGYILFEKDFSGKSAEEVMQELQQLQSISKMHYLTAVDEEGGKVTRISQLAEEPFLSPKELGDMDEILKDSNRKSEMLKELGLNWNLSPVADFTTDEGAFMYSRTYGDSIEEASTYISEVVSQMKADGMISCLKHFPGYGNSQDTHYEAADPDTRSLNEFFQQDFLPFEAGIEAGSPSVMVGHTIVSAIEDGVPASLSTEAHRILREDLGFSGVIVTDDLAMGAISEYAEGVSSSVATLALLAGNDVLLCTTGYKEYYDSIMSDLETGVIEEQLVDDAVRRIIQLKLDYGIITA